jgi:zinc transport system substrate-binding protein
MRIVFIQALSLGVMLLMACSPSQEDPKSRIATHAQKSKLSVYVVNYPLEYFVRRIGGDAVLVHFPAPRDVDPAHWSPDPETIAEFQGADLIVLNGAGYARWVDRASLPRRKLVDTSTSYSEQLIPLKEGTTHVHGRAGEHVHGEVAFTTWLDPTLASQQAQSVARALIDRKPEHTDEFRERLASLEADLATLNEGLAKLASMLGAAPVLFSHPVYQYLEARYALNGRSLHWEPDVPPDEAMWRKLEAELIEHPAKLMIWEALPLPETVRRLAALGIEIVV